MSDFPGFPTPAAAVARSSGLREAGGVSFVHGPYRVPVVIVCEKENVSGDKGARAFAFALRADCGLLKLNLGGLSTFFPPTFRHIGTVR